MIVALYRIQNTLAILKGHRSRCNLPDRDSNPSLEKSLFIQSRFKFLFHPHLIDAKTQLRVQ